MDENENLDPNTEKLKTLDKEAKAFLSNARETLKEDEKDKDLYDLKDEILSNFMGVLENSGNPKISPNSKGNYQEINYYSQSNNPNRIDIVSYAKPTMGFMRWQVCTFNEELSTYESSTLIVNPANQFIVNKAYPIRVNANKQKELVNKFLETNENLGLSFGSFYASDEIETRDEVVGTFVYDLPELK